MAESSSKKYFPAILVTIVLLYGLYLVADVFLHHDKYLWDFNIYYAAGKVFAGGGNPYDADALSKYAETKHLPYVYPPITLWFFKPLAGWNYNTAVNVFLAVKCLVLIGLAYLWKKKFLAGESDPFYYLFLLLAFNGALYCDFYTGNISIFEQALLWLGFYALIQRRPEILSLLVLVVAAFKITPILFILLLLILEGRKKYFYLLGTLALYIAIQALSYVNNPQLFKAFVNNSAGLDERSAINPSTLALLRDGFDSLAKYAGISVPGAGQMVLYLALVGVAVLLTILVALPLLRHKSPDREKVLIFLSCLVYALIMPRFKDYSYILLLAPAYFIIKSNRKLYWPLFIALALLPIPWVQLPGFEPLRSYLFGYYPLFAAYAVWIVFLKEIQSRGKNESAWVSP